MMHQETGLNNFLMPANDENSPLKWIDNIPLDYDLFNIKYNAAANYKNYRSNYVTKSSFGCKIKYPIFITPKDWEEYHKIEIQTKSQIIAEIKAIISEMPNQNISKIFTADVGKGERLKQGELVILYYEVRESLLEQQPTASVDRATQGEEEMV